MSRPFNFRITLSASGTSRPRIEKFIQAIVMPYHASVRRKDFKGTATVIEDLLVSVPRIDENKLKRGFTYQRVGFVKIRYAQRSSGGRLQFAAVNGFDTLDVITDHVDFGQIEVEGICGLGSIRAYFQKTPWLTRLGELQQKNQVA